MKKVLVITLLITGCSSAVQHEPPVLIETIDNCKVWKVDAGSRYVYTTICKRSASTEWETRRMSGKVPVTEKHRVETVEE